MHKQWLKRWFFKCQMLVLSGFFFYEWPVINLSLHSSYSRFSAEREARVHLAHHRRHHSRRHRFSWILWRTSWKQVKIADDERTNPTCRETKWMGPAITGISIDATIDRSINLRQSKQPFSSSQVYFGRVLHHSLRPDAGLLGGIDSLLCFSQTCRQSHGQRCGL